MIKFNAFLELRVELELSNKNWNVNEMGIIVRKPLLK